jgi:hypothetical protein
VLKNRALLGMLLIAMIGATVAAWFLRGQTGPPPIPNDVGQANSTGHFDPASGGRKGVQAADIDSGKQSGASTPDSGPIRVDVGASSGSDQRLCHLVVTVVAEHQGRNNPVPFTDVAAVLTGLDLASVSNRTDARGVTEYTFVGGHGHAVRCVAGIGGHQSVTLNSETTVHATILVRPKVIATGRVIDRSSVGIAEADIVLLRWPNNKHSIGSMWRIGRSGRDGSFQIPVGVGGQIAATHDNYVSSAMFMLRPNRDATQPPLTQVFELLLRPEAAIIVGLVHNEAGLPLGNAEIEVRSVTAAPVGAELVGPPHRTHSDANGTFRITGLAAGEVQWAACASNYGWREGTASLSNHDGNQLDIELSLAAGVDGFVVSRATGKAIAGATVSAGKPGTLCYRMTKTRPDGSYILDDLGSGPTTLRAELEQLVAQTEQHLLPDSIHEWRAELALGDNGNLLQGIVLDANKRPLADWQVVVRQTGREPTGMTSGEDGRFAIPVTQTKGLDVRCYAPGRPPTSFADARYRNAQAGSDVQLLTGQFKHTTIAGRVLGSGANGVPATIGCTHHQNREYARYTADADGRFTIRNAPIGTVNLTIEYTGHVAHETGELQLQPAVPVDLGSVQLSLGGGIYGTVLSPGGSAPQQCVLTLMMAGSDQGMTTECIGGSYRFAGVAPGKHTLQVNGQGLAGASFSITIEAGVDLPRDIELLAGWYRRVRVRVPPDGGQRVTLAMRIKGEATNWISSSQVQRAHPGAPGFAQFDTWMVAGTYEVAAVTPQGYAANRTITYTNDEAPPFELQLAPR